MLKKRIDSSIMIALAVSYAANVLWVSLMMLPVAFNGQVLFEKRVPRFASPLFFQKSDLLAVQVLMDGFLAD